MAGRRPDSLTGERYGTLTALRLVTTNQDGQPTVWLCKCDCGVEKPIRRTSLIQGRTKTCGTRGHDERMLEQVTEASKKLAAQAADTIEHIKQNRENLIKPWQEHWPQEESDFYAARLRAAQAYARQRNARYL